MVDELVIPWYNNIKDVQLNMSWDISSTDQESQVPWISSPMIDASISINNIPKQTATPDLVWWSTDVVWSASDNDTVAWTSWNIKLADWTSYAIDAWNTGNMTTVTYIYHDGTTTLKITTTPQTAVWTWKLLLCTAKNSTSPVKAQFQAFGTLWAWVLITADNIASNTITANQIATNTITANQMNVSNLSSISANIWTITAWDISWVTITWWTLQTASTWQRVLMNGTNNRIDFYNSDWTLSWTIAWWKVWATQVLSLSSGWYVYLWSTSLTQILYPVSSATYDIWWSWLLYKDIYISWAIDFDDWDAQLQEISWTPRWYNWTSYWMLISDWTTSASSLTATWKVTVNIAWSTFKLLYNNT